MTETFWCPGPWPWQWFRICTRELPNPDDPCNAPACVDAKARFAGARDRFTKSCDTLRLLDTVAAALRRILATPILVVIAVAIVAWLLGGPIFGTIAVVLGGFVVIYGVSWMLVFVIAKMAQAVTSILIEARTEMTTELQNILTSCPGTCRGDLSIPNCVRE